MKPRNDMQNQGQGQPAPTLAPSISRLSGGSICSCVGCITSRFNAGKAQFFDWIDEDGPFQIHMFPRLDGGVLFGLHNLTHDELLEITLPDISTASLVFFSIIKSVNPVSFVPAEESRSDCSTGSQAGARQVEAFDFSAVCNG